MTFTFDGSTATKASSEVSHFFNVSQTAQLGPSLRTRAVVDWSPTNVDGVLPTLDGATYPQGNFDILEHRQNFTASATADSVASSRWFVGARAGYFTSNRTTDNVVEEPLFIFSRPNIG